MLTSAALIGPPRILLAIYKVSQKMNENWTQLIQSLASLTRQTRDEWKAELNTILLL